MRKPKKPKSRGVNHSPGGVRAKKLTDWRQIANDYAWQLIEADKFMVVLAHSLERANEWIEMSDGAYALQAERNLEALANKAGQIASWKYTFNQVVDAKTQIVKELDAANAALQSYVASFDEYHLRTDAEIGFLSDQRRKLTAFKDLVQGLAERDLAGNLHIMRKDIDLLQ